MWSDFANSSNEMRVCILLSITVYVYCSTTALKMNLIFVIEYGLSQQTKLDWWLVVEPYPVFSTINSLALAIFYYRSPLASGGS